MSSKDIYGGRKKWFKGIHCRVKSGFHFQDHIVFFFIQISVVLCVCESKWFNITLPKEHFYTSNSHFDLHFLFYVQMKPSCACKVNLSCVNFSVCLTAAAPKTQDFADICILLLLSRNAGGRNAVWCAWSKHCTQRLGTGGQVQIHSPLERWQ